MRFPRSSGVLCHITCLPNEFGIGDFGNAAYRFVDFLEAAGQTAWQILPLSPPARGNSPYSSYSAFAGNTLLISPAMLVEDGFLAQGDLMLGDQAAGLSLTKVDFDAVSRFRRPLLRKAFDHFQKNGSEADRSRLAEFITRHAWWLDDFARYEALMVDFDQSDWTKWPSDLVHREAAALDAWDAQLSQEIEFSKFQQFVFDDQWVRLKRYANDRGVRMYGDMPIFVAHESVDVWANQELFCLDASGIPTLVAGVPPDYFSRTGQLWGNPQYRWDVLAETDYAWWTKRFEHAFHQFDWMRIDHFRGFESYWEVPAGEKNAINGRWVKGPGAKPFVAAQTQLGELPLIAEDLGMITEAVHELRNELGLPGMRVMQFGFEQEDDVFHRPSHYPEQSVAYTGTHDNDTVMGWYKKRKLDPEQADLLAEVVTDDIDIHLQLIASVLNSAADIAIVPIQDWLGMGSEARMNQPGKATGSWAWRLKPNLLTDDLVANIRSMTQQSNRIS